MPSRCCPICGQSAVKPDVTVSLKTNTAYRKGKRAKLYPQHAEILHILLTEAPGFVRHERLREAYYGGTDGPEWEISNIRAQITRLRKRIAPLGLEIGLVKGKGYFLHVKQPMHPPVIPQPVREEALA